MEFESINDCNRSKVNQFLIDHWYTTEMVLRGIIVDMTKVDGIVVCENNEIIGLITYELKNYECEILSLDSKRQNRGIGSDLVQRVIDIANNAHCYKVKLITTNDNIYAIKFYQKLGFDMVGINHNALNVSRQLKPSIPLIGEFGIPLMHEIEFERILT